MLRGMQRLVPVKFIPSVGEKTEAPRGPLLAVGVRIQTWRYYRAVYLLLGQ